MEEPAGKAGSRTGGQADHQEPTDGDKASQRTGSNTRSKELGLARQ